MSQDKNAGVQRSLSEESSAESLPLSQGEFGYLCSELCSNVKDDMPIEETMSAVLMESKNNEQMSDKQQNLAGIPWPVSINSQQHRINREISLNTILSTLSSTEKESCNNYTSLSQLESSNDVVSSTSMIPDSLNKQAEYQLFGSSNQQSMLFSEPGPLSSQNSIPANNDWEGDFGFSIGFEEQERTTKNANWTYSDIKEKLYVNLAIACPIRFYVQRPPPEGSIIRAMPIFMKAEHITDVVRRCLNHSHHTDPLNEGHPAPNHLIRCECQSAQYEEDPISGRLSVTTWYKNPPVGMHYTTYLYKFMCLGSCVGGLNRRPIQVVFTLEKDGQCLGRKVLEVRICACPGRDKKIEEKQIEKEKQKSLKRGNSMAHSSTGLSRPSPPKKSRLSNSDDDFIKVGVTNASGVGYIVKLRSCHADQIKNMLDAFLLVDMATREQRRILQHIPMQKITMHSSLKHDSSDTSTCSENERGTDPISSKKCDDSKNVVTSESTEKNQQDLNTDTETPAKSSLFKSDSDFHDGSIANWLLSLGMIAYIDKFKIIGYKCVDQLDKFTKKELNQMRIGQLHADKIWRAVVKYQMSLNSERQNHNNS